MQGFKTRAISAVVFVILMAGGILWSYYSYVFLFFILMNLLINEYINILKNVRKPNNVSRFYKPILFTTASVGFIFSTLVNSGAWPLQMMAVPLALLFFIFILELYSNAEAPLRNVAFNVLGIIYIALPIILSQFLISNENNIYDGSLLMGVVVMIWVNDMMAYLVGSRFGKTPLFKRISPKKTWEGSLGGLFGCIVVAVSAYFLVGILNWNDWLGIAGIVFIFGTYGDLVESLMKRNFNIKDSGNFMPGHGGFLDRFDALLFTIPFVVFYLLLFVWN
ncbi:MAG: phosphatidate cytidylyltransferase [Chitinophagaceae bacterium]|nr:MAG: phosphatidate cytidylyltransferase [Chitinophagaceae bacterium]